MSAYPSPEERARVAAHLADIADIVRHAVREIRQAGAPPDGQVWVFDTSTWRLRSSFTIARNAFVAVTPSATEHRHHGPYTLTSIRTGAAIGFGDEASTVAACAALAKRARLIRACERCEVDAGLEVRALLLSHGMVVS